MSRGGGLPFNTAAQAARSDPIETSPVLVLSPKNLGEAGSNVSLDDGFQSAVPTTMSSNTTYPVTSGHMTIFRDGSAIKISSAFARMRL